MRRFVSYNLIADDGQINEDFENYREAFSTYCKAVRNGNPATLYGRTAEGGLSVIVSHS